jgi:hypothetical protein
VGVDVGAAIVASRAGVPLSKTFLGAPDDDSKSVVDAKGTRQTRTVPFSRVRTVTRIPARLAAGWTDDFLDVGIITLSPISKLLNVETKPQGIGTLFDLPSISIITSIPQANDTVKPQHVNEKISRACKIPKRTVDVFT